MQIAARNAFTTGGGWVNPYVTDGLIAMWDAEWNAGGGVHDGSLYVLRDLVGNADMTLDPACTIGTNSVAFDPASPDVHNVCGGITGDIADLPERGEPITNETVGTTTGSDGWSAYKFVFAYRDGAAFNYNGRRCLNFGRWRNSATSNGMTGGYNLVDALTHTLSQSSRTVSYNEYYQYQNGQQVTFDVSSTSLPDDAKVRILTSTIPSPMGFNTLRIYNRSLTAAEIAANYAIDKARFNLP